MSWKNGTKHYSHYIHYNLFGGEGTYSVHIDKKNNVMVSMPGDPWRKADAYEKGGLMDALMDGKKNLGKILYLIETGEY